MKVGEEEVEIEGTIGVKQDDNLGLYHQNPSCINNIR